MVPPALRILGLIALASVSPLLSSLALLALLLPLTLFNSLRSSLQGLLRARWLMLTIFILYAGFTPGTALLPQLPGLSREGLMEALHRILILLLLIQAVGLLLKTTAVPQLVRGLEQLLSPLHFIGFDHHAFARRLGMTLHQMDRLQQRLRILRGQHPGSWMDVAVALISEVEFNACESHR